MRDHIKSIGDRYDAGIERDVISLQTARIPIAIEVFVVRQNGFGGAPNRWRTPRDLVAEFRVQTHRSLLLAVEWTRLVHDALRQSDLPHVVQQRSGPQGAKIRVAIEEIPPNLYRKFRDTARVSGQGGIALLDRGQQPGYHMHSHH